MYYPSRVSIVHIRDATYVLCIRLFCYAFLNLYLFITGIGVHVSYTLYGPHVSLTIRECSHSRARRGPEADETKAMTVALPRHACVLLS